MLYSVRVSQLTATTVRVGMLVPGVMYPLRARPLLAGDWAPHGVQLSRTKHALQVLPTGVDEFGVAPDLLYLLLRAVAPHVGLLEHLAEEGVLVYTVDDVAEDLLLPVGPARVAREKELAQQGMFLGHRLSS